MTWYTITLFIIIIIYAETIRKRQNKKVTEDIRSVKKDVNYQLDLIHKMFSEKECGELPVVVPPICNTDRRRTVRFNNAVLAEKEEIR